MPRALIVDDSPTMRQLLRYVLSSLEGLDVDTAQDGLEGFKKIVSGKYDIVVTEVYMPVMDGKKFIRLLRNDPNHKDVPVIVFTREAEPSLEKIMMDAGADAFIKKPLQAPDVIAVVEELLSKKGGAGRQDPGSL